MATPAIAIARSSVTPLWPGPTPARAAEGFVEWSRSETLALANHHCSLCHGLGLRGGRLDETQPCNCTLRAIFEALMRHRDKVKNENLSSQRCSLANFGKGELGRRKWSWGFPDNEFLADFELLARRVLTPHETRSKSYSIFRLHVLRGLDWKISCRLLGLDKGPFFHEVYRIQERIGRAAREMRPYPLYPIGEYYRAYSLSGSQHGLAKPTPRGDMRRPFNRSRAA